MNQFTLGMLSGLGLLAAAPGIASAGYPSDHVYACEWQQGAQRRQLALQMTTTGSNWLQGRVKSGWRNGTSTEKIVQLTNRSSVMGGKADLWRLQQTEERITCEFYVTNNGRRLLWKNCSDGSRQECAALHPSIATKGSGSPPPPNPRAPCAGLPSLPEIVQCIAGETGKNVVNSAAETCTKDVVSIANCLWIFLSAPRPLGECANKPSWICPGHHSMVPNTPCDSFEGCPSRYYCDVSNRCSEW